MSNGSGQQTNQGGFKQTMTDIQAMFRSAGNLFDPNGTTNPDHDQSWDFMEQSKSDVHVNRFQPQNVYKNGVNS